MLSKIKNEERNDRILALYNDGFNGIEIAKEIGISDSTVYSVLKKNGLSLKRNNLQEDDKLLICDLYVQNKWDEIFSRYPNLNKNNVYSIASNLGIKKSSFFWKSSDVEILKQHYGDISINELQNMLEDHHTLGAIRIKAEKIGLGKNQKWSDEEIEIFKKYYSILPKEEFAKLLPNRTENAIICKGMNLGIRSYKYLSEKYSEEEKQFILDNYKNMTDQEMADALNKPLSGIQEQRRKLGIYYNNVNYIGYENLSKMFRGHIQKWKDLSSKACNYQCVITGSKDYQVHHLYSFNKILEDVYAELDRLSFLHGYNLSDYTVTELDHMIEIFKNIHSKYPLGVCVDREIHKLFHRIYGSGGNTEQQWNKFVNDYKKGIYKEQIKTA